MTARRRIPWVVAGVVALAAAWWWLRVGAGVAVAPSAGPAVSPVPIPRGPDDGSGAAPGVEGRPADPANRLSPEHVLDRADRERLRGLAKKAGDVVAEGTKPSPAQVAALAELEWDPSTVDPRQDCAMAHLKGPCEYRWAVVVERAGPGRGRVAYARGVGLDADDPEACRDYAACIARGHLGREVAMPDALGDVLTHGRTQVDHFDPREHLDPRTLEQTLLVLEGALDDMLEQGPSGDPMWPYHLAMQRWRIQAMKRMLARAGG